MATNILVATEFFEGGKLSYQFQFDYLKKTYVKARYVVSQKADDIDNGTQLEYGTDYTIDDKTITLVTEGDTSKQLYVYRETPTDLIVVFEDSSIVRARDFNVNNEQVSHILEELSDYLILHKISDETLAFVQNAVEQIAEDLETVNILLEKVNDGVNTALGYIQEVKSMRDEVHAFTDSAQESALNANQSAQEAQEAATINSAPAFDIDTVYTFPDVVAYIDGYVYRCIGEDIKGEFPPDSQNWVRIQTTFNDFFEIDMEGNLTPSLNPSYSNVFILDVNGDIMPK